MFIIVANMPAMRSFLKILFPSCFGSSVDEDGQSTSATRTSRTKRSSVAQHRREDSIKENDSDIQLVDQEPEEFSRHAWRKM